MAPSPLVRAPDPALAHLPVARPLLPSAEAVLPYLREMDTRRWYSNFGPLLMAFEARLAGRFTDGADVVSVSSGTQALTLALKAMGLPGGLVAMPAWTFVATAHAVLDAGLTPWLVDVDPETWMLDPERMRALLPSAPGPLRAVVPVAPYGHMPALDDWAAFREETGLPVLVDAAAAFDAAVEAPVPVMVSLHATKALGIGEGGFIASRDADLLARIRQLTTYGFKGTRESHIAATNAKLSEYAGAVGLAAMDGWPTARLRWALTAQKLRIALAHTPQIAFQPGWGGRWITSVCVVRLPDGDADGIEASLQAQGVDSRRWWGDGCHRNPAFADLPRGGLANTERLAASTLGLPYSIDMTDDEIGWLAGALVTALKG